MFSIVKLQKCVYALFITFIVIAFLPAVSFSDEDTKQNICPCWERETIREAAFDAAHDDDGTISFSAWQDDPCTTPLVWRVLETMHHPKGGQETKAQAFRLISAATGVVDCQYRIDDTSVDPELHMILTAYGINERQCRACNRDLKNMHNRFGQ